MSVYQEVEACAALDWARGEVVGYAADGGGRPCIIEAAIGQLPVATSIATLPFRQVADRMPAGQRSPVENSAFVLRFTAAPKPSTGDDAPELHLSVGGDVFFSHRFACKAEIENFLQDRSMSATYQLTLSGLKKGVIHGDLIAPPDSGEPPEIALELRGERVGGVVAYPEEGEPGRFQIRATVPLEQLSDGEQILRFRASNSGEVLAAYPIGLGQRQSIATSLEIDALREELALLKRAVRRSTGGGFLAETEKPVIIAETLRYVDDLLNLQRLHLEEEIRSVLGASDPAAEG